MLLSKPHAAKQGTPTEHPRKKYTPNILGKPTPRGTRAQHSFAVTVRSYCEQHTTLLFAMRLRFGKQLVNFFPEAQRTSNKALTCLLKNKTSTTLAFNRCYWLTKTNPLVLGCGLYYSATSATTEVVVIVIFYIEQLCNYRVCSFTMCHGGVV